MGSSLGEIKELLDLCGPPEATTAEVKKRCKRESQRHLRKNKLLGAMQKSLEALVESCCNEPSLSECPMLENIASEEIKK